MHPVNDAGLFFLTDLQRTAEKMVRYAMERMGKSLPCHVVAVTGQIVTVAFDLPQGAPWVLPNITLPKAEGPWGNSPTQIGDVGITIPSDVYLGAVSGLGGNYSGYRPPGNLESLVWIPIAQKSTSISNQNAYLIQGPDGWILQTTQGTNCTIIGNQNEIDLTYGSSNITINGSSISMTAGGQTVTLDSNGLNINGIMFNTHIHSGVTSGTDDSGGPVAG